MTQVANAAVYGQLDTTISTETLRELVGNSTQVTSERDANGRISRFEIQGSDYQIQINIMPQEALTSHLPGLLGYAAHLLGETTSDHARSILKYFQGTQQVLGIVIKPGWDDRGRSQRLILGLATFYHGLFFAADAFYDPSNKLWLGPQNARPQFFIAAPPLTSDALARKARSEAILKEQGVPFISHLPTISDERTTQLRPLEEVAHRSIGLMLVAVRGEGLEVETFRELIDRYGAATWLTRKEEAAFNKTLTERERIDFTWRYEACNVLLWALSYVPDLGTPDQICDPASLVQLIKDRSTSEVIANAKRRSVSEILDQADLIYRYHWATVNAHYQGQPMPAGLEPGVVSERHYALNWLINYMDQAWDDVSTDT